MWIQIIIYFNFKYVFEYSFYVSEIIFGIFYPIFGKHYFTIIFLKYFKTN